MGDTLKQSLNHYRTVVTNKSKMGNRLETTIQRTSILGPFQTIKLSINCPIFKLIVIIRLN